MADQMPVVEPFTCPKCDRYYERVPAHVLNTLAQQQADPLAAMVRFADPPMFRCQCGHEIARPEA